MRLTTKYWGALLMKADHLIQLLDLFFKEHIDCSEITNKLVKKWFYSKPKLEFFDLNQYYRFRNSLSIYLKCYFGEYTFNFENVINFYEKINPDKEMVLSFKKLKKDVEEQSKIRKNIKGVY